MSQGWNQSGWNEIHNLIVREITDNSWQDKPSVTLRCTGYLLRELGSDRFVDEVKYPVTVRVYGYLMSYATNELAVGDKICVKGYSDTAYLNGKYPTRVTTATEIYKADWFHYFNRSI